MLFSTGMICSQIIMLRVHAIVKNNSVNLDIIYVFRGKYGLPKSWALTAS